MSQNLIIFCGSSEKSTIRSDLLSGFEKRHDNALNKNESFSDFVVDFSNKRYEVFFDFRGENIPQHKTKFDFVPKNCHHNNIYFQKSTVFIEVT
jgi:hypothetical protein